MGTGGIPGLPQYPSDDLSKDLVLAHAPRMEANGRSIPTLGGIPLLRRLGQGGMGAVYYGIHPRLGHEVAVKVLPLNVVALRPELVDRFFREARIAAKIKSPHLVSVQDVNQEGSLLYLVMDYVKGISAGGHLKRQSEAKAAIPEAQALDVCIAATAGLAEAHRNGIVHRDIKPDNILIPEDASGILRFDQAKLADLGIARGDEPGSTLTATAATMGTPGFMSPEQAMDAKTADKPADVFSMGATLYALLSGRAPFADTSAMKVLMATANKPHEPIRKLRPGVSEAAAKLIDCCLEKDPAKRFVDANALLAALKACRENADVLAPTVVATAQPVPPVSPAPPVQVHQQKKVREHTVTASRTQAAAAQARRERPAAQPAGRSSFPAALLGLAMLAVASGAGYFFLVRQDNASRNTASASPNGKTPGPITANDPGELSLTVDVDDKGSLTVRDAGFEGTSLKDAELRRAGKTRDQNEQSPVRVYFKLEPGTDVRFALKALSECAKLNIPKVSFRVTGYGDVPADLPLDRGSTSQPAALRLVIEPSDIDPGNGPVFRLLGQTEYRSSNAAKIASNIGPKDEVRLEVRTADGTQSTVTIGPVVGLLKELRSRGVERIGFIPPRFMGANDPKAVTLTVGSDIEVPPEIMNKLIQADHFETDNPSQPDTQKTLGNPDAHVFRPLKRADDKTGDDDTPGPSLDDTIGVGGGSGVFGGRNGGGRRLMVLRHGGSRAGEGAVDAALKWLSLHQEADGHWDCVKYGGKQADVAMTGMALLAFLGAGHTEKVGAFKDNVKRGIAWLISIQTENGKLFKEGETNGIGYHHAIAGMALAEAAGMGRVPETMKAAQKAIDYSTEIHQQGAGEDKLGWRYAAKEKGDLSVTSWFIMQLKSAKVAGLHVNPASFDGAIKFLDSMEEKGDAKDPMSGHRYGYTSPGHTHRNTAMGCLCRQFLGWKREDLQGGVEFFIQQGGLPASGVNGASTDLYYWYYGSLCVFQQGGELWKKWNEALKSALIENQRKGGDEAGSWDPAGAYSEYWGRIGQTALAALCLETYYRYQPLNK